MCWEIVTSGIVLPDGAADELEIVTSGTVLPDGAVDVLGDSYLWDSPS